MLARENRLTTAEDFRVAMRSGRKIASSNLVTYTKQTDSGLPPKFGFVVSKAVGNAVTRNLVKRRLRAISRQILGIAPKGLILVARALEGAATARFDQLQKELANAVTTVADKKAE